MRHQRPHRTICRLAWAGLIAASSGVVCAQSETVELPTTQAADALSVSARDDATYALAPAASLGATTLDDAVGNSLRRLGGTIAPPSDVTVSHKPDAYSTLKIRIYGSSTSLRDGYVLDAPAGTAERSGANAAPSAGSAWWALQTRLSSDHWTGHKLVLGSDLQVAPPGSAAQQGNLELLAGAGDRRHSVFVEDRSRPLPEVAMSTGVRQNWVDSAAGASQPWVALETKPQDDMAVRYVHGDAFRPTAVAAATTMPPVAQDGRATGHSVAIEHQVSAFRRWSVAAFANPARTPDALGTTAADRLLMQGTASVPRTRGVRVAASQTNRDGSQVSVDYLAQTAAVGATPVNIDPADDRRSAQLGRVTAALPLDAHWKLGAETVMISRYGATPGYGMTHLVLSGNALDDHAVMSVRVYDVLDRHPSDTSVGAALQPNVAAAPQEGRGLRVDVGLPF